EAAQAFAAAGAAAGAAAIDQNITNPSVAQLLQLSCDAVGIAVHRADFVYRLRIAGSSVRSAVNGAVGPGRQFQLAHPVLQPALHCRLPFTCILRDKEGARDAHLHWVEAAALSLDLGFVDRDVPRDIFGGGVLPEQQVEALRGDPADRALAARPHPDL